MRTSAEAGAAGAGEDIFQLSRRLRAGIEGDVHEHLVEALYADAGRIASRAVSRPGRERRATFDATLDRIVTSRVWGFPVMLGLFALIFWLTISGANVPSALLARTVRPCASVRSTSKLSPAK